MQENFGNAFVNEQIFRLGEGGVSADPGGAGGAFGAAAASPTSPLPFRAEMEAAFGQDFSGVKAHLGQSGPMEALSANAAASGEHVAFSSPSPDREVVAHELTHVVQQGAGGAEDGLIQREAVSGGGTSGNSGVSTTPSTSGVGSAPQPQAGAQSGGAQNNTQLKPAIDRYNLGPGTETERKAAEAFVKAGVRSQEGFLPSSGFGGFDVSYDPGHLGYGVLTATLRSAVQFIDPVQGSTRGNIKPTKPHYQKMAAALNQLPQSQLDRILPEFKWGSDDNARKEWIYGLRTSVEGVFSEKYEFHLHKPGWSWIGSRVKVNLIFAEREGGGRDKKDHLLVDAVKTPDIAMFNELVNDQVGMGSDKNAYDQHMILRSNYNRLILNSRAINFKKNDVTVEAGGRTQIQKMLRALSGDPDNPSSHALKLRIDGYALGEEQNPMDLSERRARNVASCFKAEGFEKADERLIVEGWGATLVQKPQVEISPKTTSVTQNVGAHEFGHALGLGDEYPTHDKKGNKFSEASGGPVGKPTLHDQAVKKMLDESGKPMSGSIFEGEDGIMSYGNKLRPQHYSIFCEALRGLTQQDLWALGPPDRSLVPMTSDNTTPQR